MIIFYVYFVQIGTIARDQKKNVKVSLKRSKDNILNFKKKFNVILHICSCSLNVNFQKMCITF
jgi:hypothetical protein